MRLLTGVIGLVVVLLMGGCADSGDAPAGSATPPAASAVESTATSSVAAAPAPAAQTGEEVFNRFCASCHLRGLAGAVAAGDPKWQELAANGIEPLIVSARTGVPPAMPPKGLCQKCSDEELGNAIQYMIDYQPGG